MTAYRIEHYLSAAEHKDLYIEWLRRLRVLRLACGGDKRTQDADIMRAVDYWIDWQGRTDDEKQTP